MKEKYFFFLVVDCWLKLYMDWILFIVWVFFFSFVNFENDIEYWRLWVKGENKIFYEKGKDIRYIEVS